MYLPQDGFKEIPTTVLYSIANQLDTARLFIWNEITRVKYPVDLASNKQIGGIIMICVGIDIAKDKHNRFILISEGEVLADVFTIPTTSVFLSQSTVRDALIFIPFLRYNLHYQIRA